MEARQSNPGCRGIVSPEQRSSGGVRHCLSSSLAAMIRQRTVFDGDQPNPGCRVRFMAADIHVPLHGACPAVAHCSAATRAREATAHSRPPGKSSHIMRDREGADRSWLDSLFLFWRENRPPLPITRGANGPCCRCAMDDEG